MDYTKLVPKPDAASINSGLKSLSQRTMMEIFGNPSANKGTECGPVTNPKLKKSIVTRSVGPFRVTGHKAAVESLKKVLASVKAEKPDLYAALGTAGMICARLVRGSTSSWSNHSWGFAVDLTVGGKLDPRGDDMVQEGMLALYPFFHREGWWWGAEFKTEDAMHFEVAEETVKAWHQAGLL
ncbi:MAG: M15 family metallopeptidase [Fimbriimonas sp.]